MAGTKEGGKKTAVTIKKKYGDDYYRNIGAKGGRNGHTGGFASNPELARVAGRKGGLAPRRKRIEMNENGGTIRKDGEKLGTPKHGEQEKINLWQRIYRGGRTKVGED